MIRRFHSILALFVAFGFLMFLVAASVIYPRFTSFTTSSVLLRHSYVFLRSTAKFTV